MRTLADTRPFCDVAIGEEFRVSAFMEGDNGMDALSKPGTHIYVKTGERTYRRVFGKSTYGNRARSVLMKTWPPE